MAEVKRYAPRSSWQCGVDAAKMVSSEHGEWIHCSDYTAIERERNALDGALQREQYETARLQERVTELTAEVERLRKVEAAANVVLDGRARPDGQPGHLDWLALAEACGRKG